MKIDEFRKVLHNNYGDLVVKQKVVLELNKQSVGILTDDRELVKKSLVELMIYTAIIKDIYSFDDDNLDEEAYKICNDLYDSLLDKDLANDRLERIKNR